MQALRTVPDEERDRAERKVKLRTMGNIRLIAELYKQEVVPEKILHACIQEMLGDGKSEPIEDNVEVRSGLHLPPLIGHCLLKTMWRCAQASIAYLS